VTILPFLLLATQAVTVDGVKLDDKMQVGSTSLVFNGGATRKKAIFRVYVGGLYLSHVMHETNAIIADTGPRALVMRFVRDVDKKALSGAFLDGFGHNAPDKLRNCRADVDRMLQSLPDVHDGDELRFVYDPSRGSTVSYNGKSLAEVKGKDFADLYVLVFLGDHPPTDDLKEGLLGLPD
jgi:hypothetical protein